MERHAEQTIPFTTPACTSIKYLCVLGNISGLGALIMRADMSGYEALRGRQPQGNFTNGLSTKPVPWPQVLALRAGWAERMPILIRRITRRPEVMGLVKTPWWPAGPVVIDAGMAALLMMIPKGSPLSVKKARVDTGASGAARHSG